MDDDLQTPLHCAIANGHTAAVERLTLKQPCREMHVADRYQMLPLHLACEGGDQDLIALLLARGARVASTPISPVRPARACAADEPPSAADIAAPAEAESPEAPASPEGSHHGASGRSPVPKRKQLLAMQRSEVGGSAVFIARQHEHHAVVALLERAASGESIPFPQSVTDSLSREASERRPPRA